MDVLDMALFDSWAEHEFFHVDLGHERRNRRLIELAQTLGAHPSASLPDATLDPAQLKAAYRFFNTTRVEPAEILAGHVRATYDRLASVSRVLAVQDTSLLDWTHHPATTGLGPLASENQQGLLLHSTLTFTPDRIPLGLLGAQTWARDPATYGQRHDHKDRPISDKESQKWLTSLDDVIAARAACPNTEFVSIGDAEADVYDFLVKDRPDGVEFLIRAGQNRCVVHEQHYLWDCMTEGRLAGQAQLDIPCRNGQPARHATITVRDAEVTVRCPAKRRKEG